jgi:simple sugar transport system permease protein
VLGALIIQTLTTTVYAMNITPQTSLLFKAIVVIAVCLIQSPQFRAAVTRRRRRPPTAPAPTETTKVEVPA